MGSLKRRNNWVIHGDRAGILPLQEQVLSSQQAFGVASWFLFVIFPLYISFRLEV